MYNVAVVGCTGAVGKEMISVLHDREFPLKSLRLFASERSAGTAQDTPFGETMVEAFSLEKMEGIDIALLAVSGGFSKEYARKISDMGVTVIDNSSALRLEDDVPLIVPEINGDLAKDAKLIANPNCTTAILAVALWPIHQSFNCKKVIVSTYQATSGGGAPAMEELREQTKRVLEGQSAEHDKFAHPIPFNIIPHIDVFQPNLYTKEEMKVAWETQKIFGEPDMPISCTAVRIPTFRAHAESVTIETEEKITPEAVREIFEWAPGVELVDSPEDLQYPMPLTATKKYDIEAGRVRQSLVFGEYGIDFFVCGDQLLKGAALNAVQIAEVCIEQE